jgi:hypothetical protein
MRRPEMLFIGNEGLVMKIPAAKITAAKLSTSTGRCVVTMTGENGESFTRSYSGQDAVDLYRALSAIQSATLSTVA